jgi:hypothetical protein
MKQVSRTLWAFRIVLVVFVACLIAAEILFYVPPAQAGINTSIAIVQAPPGAYNLTFDAKSSFAANLTASATVSNLVLTAPVLYVYYDASYPSSWSEPVWSFGLPQHLAAVLAGRGLFPSIVRLDASQLLGFLTSKTTTDSILFMPMGVIPDTVYNKTVNLLSPWIRAGGTLVWFGDTIGYYSGEANTPLTFPSSENPGLAGVSEFVNVTLFGSSNEVYANQSVASHAYGFEYDYGIAGHGLNVTVLQSEGGEVLGGVAGNFTNAARIPLGNGTIDYFSVPLSYDITGLSVSLVNMLQSGVLTGPFQPLATISTVLTAGLTFNGYIFIKVPYLPWLSANSSVCLLLYQSNPLAIYGNVGCARLT